MEILNIGPLELIVILVVMFVLLGPKQMILTAYRIGKFFRGVVRSPMWREIINYSQEIRELPQKLMEETGLEESLAEVKKSTKEATDEINNQIKEVTAAARVPEAEHIRLDTGAGLASGSTPAAPLTPAVSTLPVTDAATTAAGVTTNMPSVGIPIGIPVMNQPNNGTSTQQTPAALPYEPALRPRHMRPLEMINDGHQAVVLAAPAIASGSFAPRAVRRIHVEEAVVIAATGAVETAAGHNGTNGSGDSSSIDSLRTDVSARMVPPAEETEPRDAVE